LVATRTCCEDRRAAERAQRGGTQLIVGVDEVGRGAWAGPLVVAAFACLPSEHTEADPSMPQCAGHTQGVGQPHAYPHPEGTRLLHGVRDSKKLTPSRRHRLFGQLTCPEIACDCSHSVADATSLHHRLYAYALVALSVSDVDAVGVHRATRVAMGRAIEQLYCVLAAHGGEAARVGTVYVDGRDLPEARVPWALQAVVGGDDSIPAISAASIIAKVTRDTHMEHLAHAYPQYGWASNKGYGTALHREALKDHGPCMHHRQSFAPIKLQKFA
jgi:ribonuclease HII